MASNLIEIQALSKVYGSGDIAVHALDEVSVTIHQGEYVAVMGASGSGKSTLMNIIGCLDRPTSGTYILDGKDVSKLSKRALADVRSEKIGFVFQSFNLLPRLTALKNVKLPLLYYANGSRSAEEQEAQARAMLEAVGLGDRAHHRPNELSGGQQQRVAIARALVNQPPLILADEPTGNLDSRSGEEILTLLDDLHAQGTTIVMVTHDQNNASHAKRIIYLQDGIVVSDEQNKSVEPMGDEQ